MYLKERKMKTSVLKLKIENNLQYKSICILKPYSSFSFSIGHFLFLIWGLYKQHQHQKERERERRRKKNCLFISDMLIAGLNICLKLDFDVF